MMRTPDRPQWFHGDFIGMDFVVINKTTLPLHTSAIDYDRLKHKTWIAMYRGDVSLPDYIEASARGEAIDDTHNLILLACKG